MDEITFVEIIKCKGLDGFYHFRRSVSFVFCTYRNRIIIKLDYLYYSPPLPDNVGAWLVIALAKVKNQY